MQLLLKTLTSFNAYLEDGKEKVFTDQLSAYQNRMALLKIDFYRTPIGSNPLLNDKIRVLLKNLNVDKKQWGRYLGSSMTVYALLEELSELKKENDKLTVFVKCLRDYHHQKWIRMLLGGLVTFGLFELSLPIMANVAGLSTTQELIAAAVFAPVIGAVFTTAVAIYSFHQTLTDKRLSMRRQFLENFFLSANLIFKYTAFGLLFTAMTTTTPIVATLFLLAEGVNVLKEVVNLIHLSIQNRQKQSLFSTSDLSSMQAKVREALDVEKQRNRVLVDLATGVLCAGVVAAWCFIPGGMMLALLAGISIGLIYLARYKAQHSIEKSFKMKLERQFETVEQQHEERPPDLKIVNESDQSRIEEDMSTPLFFEKGGLAGFTPPLESDSPEEEFSGSVSSSRHAFFTKALETSFPPQKIQEEVMGSTALQFFGP